MLSAIAGRLRPPRIEGFVDKVIAGEVGGWAFDATHPSRRVHIVARSGADVIAETLADIPRNDLLALGKGDGRHGFRLRIPGDLSVQARASIVIEAVAKPRNVMLKRGQVKLPAPAPSEDHRSPKSVLRAGFLERFDGQTLTGWAVDPGQPGRVISIDVFDGEAFLGVAKCDQDRPGLAGKAPTGAKGFAFQWPAELLPVNGERLRARISGTRLELARSKGYLHEPTPTNREGAGRQDNDREQVRRRDLSKLASVAQPPTVAFLICGDGSAEAFTRTEKKCRAQSVADTFAMRVTEHGIDLDRLALCSAVVLLKPGQEVDPLLAETLISAAGLADAWTWRTAPAAAKRALPGRLGALSGNLGGALALSGFALGRLEKAQLAALRTGEVDTLARSLAGQGLRWRTLSSLLSSAGPASQNIAPADTPRRISLAIWSGWDDEEPLALEPLLSGCSGMEIELVAIADSLRPEKAAALASQSARFDLRLVDEPQGRGAGAVWRALSEAATGEVVVLCAGHAVLAEPRAVQRLAAWAQPADVGVVTARLRSPDGVHVADGLEIDIASGRVRPCAPEAPPAVHPVDAASSSFLVVSRAKLASLGGFDARRLPNEFGDVDLGARLMSAGLVNLCVPQVCVTLHEPAACFEEQALNALQLAILERGRAFQ